MKTEMGRQVQVLGIVDPDADFLKWASNHLRAEGVEVATFTDAESALKYNAERRFDILLTELKIGPINGLELLRRVRGSDPNAMVLLTTGFPTTNQVIEAMKLGAHDFLRKESLSYDLRPVVEGVLMVREQLKANEDEEEVEPMPVGDTIIGRSAAMQDVFKMIGRVSRSDAPVMVTGESGSGKEVVANAIHKFSGRAANDFVAINCAAIPENLLESELFGHEKGSFTGATVQRVGRFEQCDGGTLFLDEIGDMPLQTQGKILRVLQEGEFSRVGGNQTLKTDVRILAATNRLLENEVEVGRFREDLFYRLNVIRIHIPPLRERREDIRPLAEFFLQRISTQKRVSRKRLASDAVELLEKHRWPGNVRELENTMLRACALSNTEVLLPKDIPLGRVPQNPSLAYRVGSASGRLERGGGYEGGETGGGTADAGVVEAGKSVEVAASEDAVAEAVSTLIKAAEADKELALLPWMEREVTRYAFEKTGKNQVQAAKLLGVTRATLRKRLERFGIE